MIPNNDSNDPLVMMAKKKVKVNLSNENETSGITVNSHHFYDEIINFFLNSYVLFLLFIAIALYTSEFP